MEKRNTKKIMIAAFCLAWMAAGLTGFVASLFCIARSGSVAEKILGVLISVLTGPFFWAYVFAMKGYCRKVK